MVDDWGTGTGSGSGTSWPSPDDETVEEERPLPGWMRRAPSGDHGSRGTTFGERARHLGNKLRRRPPLNAPVYTYAPTPAPVSAEETSFWAAGKGILLGSAFAAGSLALVLILVALVRTAPGDADTDPDDGIEIAGDPTTTLPRSGFDSAKVPLEAPTSTTTTAPPTTEAPTTVATTAPTTTAPPTTAPPTTAPTTTGPTTTRPPAPVITSFQVQYAWGWCNRRSEIRVGFSWSTTNATAAQLGPEGGGAESVDPGGGYDEECVERQQTWVLSVSGPGGTANASVVTPS